LSEPYLVAEDDAYQLLAYLIASAEIGIVEPAFYGPRRLLDAAARLAGAMAGQARPEQRPWLAAFAQEATEAMALARRQPDEFEEFLHAAARGIATQLKQQEERSTDGAGAVAEAEGA
jgi:hypothetical protein